MSTWTEVSKQPPEPYVSVLAYFTGAEWPHAIAMRDDKGEWFRAEGACEYFDCHPTHWQELTQP